MKTEVAPILAKGRVRYGKYATPDDAGLVGAFTVVCPESGRILNILSSGIPTPQEWAESGMAGDPWEHVSVTVNTGSKRTQRPPGWLEMDWVKGLFWGAEETVVQFHPAESQKIDVHRGCLHLWKPPYVIELPPGVCV